MSAEHRRQPLSFVGLSMSRHPALRLLMAFALLLCAPLAMASGGAAMEPQWLDLTSREVGHAALIVFALAYALVMTEEFLHLRKSKPVIIAAGLIWGMIAYVYAQEGLNHAVEQAVRHNLLEYAELMLFLLVAMAYINAMQERKVFDALRAFLIRRGFGFRTLFLMTGGLSFFISPLADNLTTALMMCAVVMAVGAGNRTFISLACINIVVAANAGGAFSPFGDITTLMVWQSGQLGFFAFFALVVPSVVNYAIPAAFMYRSVPDEHPRTESERVAMKRGAKRIVLLFLLTIATAVSFHHNLHLPPVIGMLTGLGFLKLFGFYLSMTHHGWKARNSMRAREMGDMVPFDVFQNIARAEWDTLMFFYGVVLCVGGLGFIGYLGLLSEAMYTGWGATLANISVGIISAVVDNIPVMFAVLTMSPEMSDAQWLLVTLTAGVGGSLLSIGSAAGVALMGQARGAYTFFTHLRWTPVISLGYFASILAHLIIQFFVGLF